MTDIVPFSFEDDGPIQIRVVVRDGEPWFVAADVCRALDLDQPTNAVKSLDCDEVALTIIKGKGGDREANIVSEPGLYALIGKSRKPAAKRFDRFVRHVILPTIRRTGKFELPAATQPDLLPAIDQIVEKQLLPVKERLGRIEAKLEDGRFSEATKRYVCESVAKYNNCECIFCSDAVVVTRLGQRLENTQFHHADGNRSNNRPQNCTLSCADCHERITHPSRPDHLEAHKAQSLALAFHERVRQKIAQIKSPNAAPVKHWDFRAATQSDMGFPVSIKRSA